MLRIEIQDDAHEARIYLEGKLVGPWVNELERTWYRLTREHPQKPVVVDFARVIFIDSGGKKLLERMHHSGVGLQNGNLMTKGVIEEIKAA